MVNFYVYQLKYVAGVVRWADGVKIDEIPGGHLIQPNVGQIKSRYMTSTKPEVKTSGKAYYVIMILLQRIDRRRKVTYVYIS